LEDDDKNISWNERDIWLHNRQLRYERYTHGNFETFFVSLRKILENNSSCCLDNEDERLKVCQEFAEFINHNPYYLFSAVKRQRK
jgi:hypothetical protein